MTNPVEELLKSKNIYFTISGQDYLTKCINPEHTDNSPSFRIDRTTGICHCFSCGFKANIFKHFGVLTNNVSIKIAKLKQKLRDVTEQLKGLEYPDGYTPISQQFRGISIITLRKFGAFYTDKVDKLVDRICFPVPDITGRTAVFVARHTMSNANPRYVNYPVGVSMPLFPSSVPKENFTTIVLVEGLFDMLNLYDKGIHNAICCFGTNTLSSGLREKLLPFKAQGITKVFILFDGDTAGREAAKKLKPLIEEENFLVEIIDLPDDEDPGSLAEEDIRSIMEYIK
jgi:DNA primase